MISKARPQIGNAGKCMKTLEESVVSQQFQNPTPTGQSRSSQCLFGVRGLEPLQLQLDESLLQLIQFAPLGLQFGLQPRAILTQLGVLQFQDVDRGAGNIHLRVAVRYQGGPGNMLGISRHSTNCTGFSCGTWTDSSMWRQCSNGPTNSQQRG